MGSNDINYNDERLASVENEKQETLKTVEKTYENMIDQAENFYQDQIDASENWAEKQSQLQQEQTDFAIEQIEQQKDQAKSDYIREQSGAYVDWQKQSNPYGANAEQMAANGMTNTGFSESSQVGMHNAYQNRVATARESYNRAVMNYDNAIKDARLQNNSVLAEIAEQALQQQLELALEGFQYKNQLIIEKSNKRYEVENEYQSIYQDVLDQISAESAVEPEESEEIISGGGGKIKKTSSKITNGGKVSQKAFGSDGESGSSSTWDINSIMALGYGPISAAELDRLVISGEVIEYTENGKLKFKKNPGNRASNFGAAPGLSLDSLKRTPGADGSGKIAVRKNFGYDMG